MSAARCEGAFTFVEILAAMLFMAIVLPALIGGLTLANRASVTAERMSIAGQLAHNQMNDLMATGTWQTSTGKGEFGADYPGYRWEVTQDTWSYDSNNTMSEVTMHVYFDVQGVEHEVKLTALNNTLLTTAATAQ